MSKFFMAALGGAFLVAVPQAASAQMATGEELRGHSVRVETTGGVVNTVHFDADGTARIVSQSGNSTVAGNWFVQNQMICLQTASARECWPYQTAFQAGQPVVLTSDCSATSRWTALSTAPVAPPPEQQRSGERG